MVPLCAGAFHHVLAIEKRTAVRTMAVLTRPLTGTAKNDAWWDDVERVYTKYAEVARGAHTHRTA